MTRTIIKGQQQDEAWRKLRLGCATASGFAHVLAKGKGNEEATTRRNYRVRLALELLTGVPEHDDLTYKRDIALGIEREPAGRLAFEEATGHLVQEVAFVKLNSMPIGCSPDGLIGDDAGFEIKCPSKAVHYEYLSLSAPPSVYIPQVQGCMYVTGRSHWWFATYNPDYPPELRLHSFLVKRDDDYISRLEDSLILFNSEVRKTIAEMQQLIEQRKL